jgi:hypothetical protein
MAPTRPPASGRSEPRGRDGADRLEAEYVLPLRWADNSDLDDLTDYLRRLAGWIDVTVVDGSDAGLFATHAARWASLVRHIPAADRPGTNGKVRGVLTGVDLARHERIVLGDDDVRYDRAALATVVGLLDTADAVVPQNYFVPLPWHARWDTARTLLNRALHRDYAGTMAVRRSVLARTGGYDADTLFENLELERTVRAVGGTVRVAGDVFVVRRPPSASHFLQQRVRQAYDSLAQPFRLALEAAILPAAIWTLRRPRRLLVAMAATVCVAEYGRRKQGGRDHFPATSALWAPVWIAERSVAVWLAIGCRLRGGIRYGDVRIVKAASPVRVLRRRFAVD